MKVMDYLRCLLSCFSNTSTKPSATVTTSATAVSTTATIKSRLSASIVDLFRDRQEPQESQEEDSLIDAASSAASAHHHNPPPTPSSSSLVVGTIFGHRRGRVAFCVQFDPAVPPPFLFELSMPTYLLAREMISSGLLRIALECQRAPRDSCHHQTSAGGRRASSVPPAPPVWKAYCNGRKVGYAVRRAPSEKECAVLEAVRVMSAGAGVLAAAAAEEGEVLYMRGGYERVVGSRDSVSYHLVSPGGSSPSQGLSVFLLRTG